MENLGTIPHGESLRNWRESGYYRGQRTSLRLTPLARRRRRRSSRRDKIKFTYISSFARTGVRERERVYSSIVAVFASPDPSGDLPTNLHCARRYFYPLRLSSSGEVSRERERERAFCCCCAVLLMPFFRNSKRKVSREWRGFGFIFFHRFTEAVLVQAVS